MIGRRGREPLIRSERNSQVGHQQFQYVCTEVGNQIKATVPLVLGFSFKVCAWQQSARLSMSGPLSGLGLVNDPSDLVFAVLT